MPERKSQELSGLRKTAILLVSLGEERASKILSTLDNEMIELITTEIAQVEAVEDQDQELVIKEFYQLSLARKYYETGGIAYARQLLERSLPEERANEILESVEQSIRMTPFNFLRKTEPSNILTFIRDEHPQTIALIMAHLKPEQAAEVLSGLAAPKQVDVIKRLSHMEDTSPEVIREVEAGLEGRLASLVGQKLERAGGIEASAEVLNFADRATEKGILEAIEQDDPELVENIRRLMFVFEDILLVDDRGVQKVLQEVDHETLAMALKSATDEVKDKVFRNLSERARTVIQEDMEYMGPVRLTEVEAAQQKIVDMIRRMEDAGEIIIQGRGGEEEVVV
jgi:flagellar motor switch protein FliG